MQIRKFKYIYTTGVLELFFNRELPDGLLNRNIDYFGRQAVEIH